jgi:flavin reductase (DIM6/NTAB) family NADH-FMN oxidoreductase RutF
VIVDPASAPPNAVYKLMIGSIVPRPIAFVSTVSTEGRRNLAPFSFFNGVSGDPPVVCFSATFREPRKDTYLNIQATREFVVNIVSEEIAEQMNLCSGDYPHGTDEFEISGLTPVASDVVSAPRVAESKVSMECRLMQIVEVGGGLHRGGGASLILGEVVRFHVEDGLAENFRVDAEKLHAIGRMGGNEYTRTRDRFEMIRPKV